MGKFEKGQYVRVLHTDYPEVLAVDDVFKVGASYDHGVEPDGKNSEWFFLNGEIEAWKPKVGDRVRLTNDNGGWGAKGDEGLVGEIDGESTRIDFTTGAEAGDFWYVHLDNIEPITTLTIEDGKFYKTRDGLKVGPMVKQDGYLYHGGWHYGYDGHCGYEGGDTLKFAERDLIAEWVDEPLAQPAAKPAKASNDNAEPTKPKFKVGDRVSDISDSAPSGKGKSFATVADVRGDEISVIWDGCGSGGDSYWDAVEFELVTPAPSTPAIVALIENGTAKPATRPKVHPDQASATTEAERLALEFPGQQFGVFVLADSKIADVVNVPTAVLRAA